MNDAPITVAPVQQMTIAATPEQVSALPVEQRTSLLETYRRGGYSQGELDRVFGAEAKPAPQLTREQQAQARYEADMAGSTRPEDFDLSALHSEYEISAKDMGQMREFLAGSGFPRQMGPEIIRSLHAGITEQGDMNDAQRDDYQVHQRALAVRITRADDYQALITTAKVAVDAMSPAARKVLEDHAAGLEKADMLVHLYRQGERILARQKR